MNDEIERLIKPSGLRIHFLLKNSFQVVQISRASPAWEEYVDHIDALVLDGLKQTCLKSLRSMLNTLVLANVSEVGILQARVKCYGILTVVVFCGWGGGGYTFIVAVVIHDKHYTEIFQWD